MVTGSTKVARYTRVLTGIVTSFFIPCIAEAKTKAVSSLKVIPIAGLADKSIILFQ